MEPGFVQAGTTARDIPGLGIVSWSLVSCRGNYAEMRSNWDYTGQLLHALEKFSVYGGSPVVCPVYLVKDPSVGNLLGRPCIVWLVYYLGPCGETLVKS